MVIIFLYFFGVVSAILFFLMKIELSSRNPDEDYIFRHHFSFWSEYKEIYSNEKDPKFKKKYRIIFYSFNLSIILVFLLSLWSF
jgi:hypothetical protein